VTTSVLGHRGPIETAKTIAMRPPAKLNLSLVVFDRQPDGYHDLHTVMATVNLHDDLHIRISDKPGIHLSCDGLPSPKDHENLVYRAAELLARHNNIQPALEIYLNKRIPSGAGLGGGSSDAAACLLGLNRLWALGLPIEQLDSLAAELGCDVPFFLHGPVAYCTGKGEIVMELPHRCRRHVLLIVPDIRTSTAEVYRNYTCDRIRAEEGVSLIRYFLQRGDLDGLLTQGINSLTGSAMTLFEPLRILQHKIEDMNISPVHMSGSGSCLFVTSESHEQITQWAKQIRKRNLAQTFEVNFHDHGELFVEVHHGGV